MKLVGSIGGICKNTGLETLCEYNSDFLLLLIKHAKYGYTSRRDKIDCWSK